MSVDEWGHECHYMSGNISDIVRVLTVTPATSKKLHYCRCHLIKNDDFDSHSRHEYVVGLHLCRFIILR